MSATIAVSELLDLPLVKTSDQDFSIPMYVSQSTLLCSFVAHRVKGTATSPLVAAFECYIRFTHHDLMMPHT